MLFDNSKPAYDVNSEYESGQLTAWGPRPAQLLILAEPQRSLYTGKEWYFVIFRNHCRKWVQRHGYALPPWPIHKK